MFDRHMTTQLEPTYHGVLSYVQNNDCGVILEHVQQGIGPLVGQATLLQVQCWSQETIGQSFISGHWGNALIS